MENKKNKKSRVSEYIIVVIVVLSAVLLIMDISERVSEEIDMLNKSVVVETSTPMPNTIPTLDPEVTMEWNPDS